MGTMTVNASRQVYRLLVLGCILAAGVCDNPYVEMQPKKDIRSRFFGGQEGMGWTQPISDGETSYSVIVVEADSRASHLFRDMQRVRAYSEEGVASVQFAAPDVQTPLSSFEAPFAVAHPGNVDKRVRIVYLHDLNTEDPNQMAHLRASCEDEHEKTIIVIVDETCQMGALPEAVSSSCGSEVNVVRIYPFNNASLDVTSISAYIPLGPRCTFPFIARNNVQNAQDRSLLLNLQVGDSTTSPRRRSVMEMVDQFAMLNPEVRIWPSANRLSSTEWQQLLLDSKFTIAPGGHNPETHRTWEALEAGSIPIISRNDFRHPGYQLNNRSCGSGDVAWNTVAASPFARAVSVDTWDALPALLDALAKKSDAEVSKLQAESMAWYSALMRQTYKSMLNFGEGDDLFPQIGPIVDHGEGFR